MDQQPLFRLAVEAMAMSARFVPMEGWHVVLTARRGDEEWAASERRTYTHLTSEELVDVLEAEVARWLLEKAPS